MTLNQSRDHRARIVGRTLRLLLGVALTWITYDVMRGEDAGFNTRIAGGFIALTVFYSAVHVMVSRYAPDVNPWLGAFLAVTPVVLLFLFGGPIGRVASVEYVGLSLILQATRSDGGCEVMSVPAILFRKRSHLVCIAFSPIDWLEERLANR